jgi:hypothetical protein
MDSLSGERKERRMAKEGCGATRLAGELAAATIMIVATVWPDRALGGKGGELIVLRESKRAGTTTRVQTELKARGLYRPGVPPSGPSGEARMPKPLTVEIDTRFIFHERMVEIDSKGLAGAARVAQLNSAGDQPEKGRALRAARHVIEAGLAVNGEVRLMSALIRPEVRLLVAERRERDGPVVVVSPSGPLTWNELELVQALGDPLTLPDLLPERPVAVGEHWRVRYGAAQALSEYDVITSSTLDAALESADADRARIRLTGQIQGSARGGAGKMTCEGFLTFDRRLARIGHLDMNRVESRQPGPVEAGLDIKSTLTMTRHAAEPPAALSDASLSGLSLEITPARELLRLEMPGGTATILHDRQWHMFWEDPKLIVLKRLEGGQVIAQCNFMQGPHAGQGRHQDPTQFRDDIRRGLKKRFVRYLGAGEVDGHPAGGYRYKVGIQGREGQLGIVWYYYMVASPLGEQLLATFTMAEDHVTLFGDQDVAIIGSLQWHKKSPPVSRE